MTRAEEIGIKRERVRRFLREQELDGILMTRQSTFSWYTGGGNGFVASVEAAGSILAMRDRDVLITDNIEAPRLKAEELGGFKGVFKGTVKAAISRHGGLRDKLRLT